MLVRFRPKRGANTAREAPADGFAALALAHLDSLYGAALRLAGNRADADDLIQETYLRAFRASHQFAAGSNLKAWLFTILYNVDRNTRRDNRRDPVEIDSEMTERAAGQPDRQASPEQVLIHRTLDADLQAALDSLPPVFRQAVWLRDVEEFSYAEIAALEGVPVGTVMSRISRGRRLLHDRLLARTGDVLAGRP